jgi:DNA/RNA-binding domain of Phe-tRNA-synthetase-like protein
MSLPAIGRGSIAPELAAELPGLAIGWIEIAARPRRSPEPVRHRLRELASRITGAKVVHSRQDAVPWAYRVLWRRLGLDPDGDRTPVERLMVQRLQLGGLPSQGLPADAVVLATLETGVPVVVLDSAKVSGRIQLRPALTGERLGGDEQLPLRTGEVVYADDRQPLARLTGEPAPSADVTAATTSMLVCALCAAGVPQMAIEEALWTVADVVGAAGTLEGSNPGRTA